MEKRVRCDKVRRRQSGCVRVLGLGGDSIRDGAGRQEGVPGSQAGEETSSG